MMTRYIALIAALVLGSAATHAEDLNWQTCLQLQSNPAYVAVHGAAEDPITQCHVPEGKARDTDVWDNVTTAVNIMFRYNPDWVERNCQRGVNRVTCEYRGRTYTMGRAYVNGAGFRGGSW
jgi:hypothetical protein